MDFRSALASECRRENGPRQTPPEKLAGLTLTIIEGEEGAAKKELDRLVAFLRDHVKPRVILLPNLMFIGMARAFSRELGVPVACEMTGEDIFLDAMQKSDFTRIREVIRGRAADVARFVATSDYYAGRMAEYLDVERDRIEVVYTGIGSDFFTPVIRRDASSGPPTVGYLGRICPEKGLGRLIDAMIILKKLPGMADAHLRVAGYLGAKDQKWFDALRKRIGSAGLESSVEYLGEVDRAGKFRMLDSIDVFTMPTAYPEAKGVSIIEALARGVPVVQPAHGSFPELIEQTGGGLLVPPDDAPTLANALADLLRDAPRRRLLGDKGRAIVESIFTEDRMAENMLKVFDGLLTPVPRTDAVGVRSEFSL